MAENEEGRSSEDLTEEASPHRLEEARQKGMVAQSKEVTGMAVLLAVAVTTFILSPKMGDQLAEFMREVLENAFTRQGPSLFLMKAFKLTLSLGLPICCIGFAIGIVGSIVQVGAVFSWDPLMPDFSRINPLDGTQKLFSLKQFIDSLKLIGKTIIALVVAAILLKTEILKSIATFGFDSGAIMHTFADESKVLFSSLMIVFTVFAAIDFGMQRFEFNKGLRMTKQEAKQEHKEREGDPQIRARIRAIQREVSRKRMMQAVKKADVVITNPTHIAVALVYDSNKASAPKVVAKGADLVAQKIKQIAAEAGVPLVENVPLARTLYKTVKLGQVIPRNLYQAVAEVLAYVYKLRRNST